MTRARSRVRSGPVDRYGVLERAAQAAARRNGAALWYLGRDLSAAYGDVNGTTATSVGGAVGLLMDRSYGLAGSLGPNVVANSNFSSWTGDNPDGWPLVFTETATMYVSQVGTGVRMVSDGGYNGIRQIPLIAGRRYRATITVASVASGTWAFCSPAINTIISGSSAGTFSTEFVATSDEIALKRATSGQAADFVIQSVEVREISVSSGLGAELVTNGAFADATGWAADSSFSISGGVANFTGATGFMLQSATGIVAGRTYLLSYDVNITAGAVQFNVGSVTAPTGHSAGTTGRRSYYITATSNSSPRVYSNAASGWVDNVSVREVLGNPAVQSNSSYKPNAVLLPSGYYGLDFNGIDDFLGAPAPAVVPTKEVFIAAASSTVASEVRAIAGRRVATTSGCLVRTNANRYEAVGIVSNSPFGLADSNTVIASDTANVVDVDFTSTTLSIQINGSTRINGNAAITLAPNTARVGIGSFSGDGFAQGWKGSVALVAWAPNEIPEADRILIKRFAALLAGAPYTG